MRGFCTSIYLILSRIILSVDEHVCYLFIIKPSRCTNFTNLFWHETLHISSSSSAHHQEFVNCTLRSGICHTVL